MEYKKCLDCDINLVKYGEDYCALCKRNPRNMNRIFDLNLEMEIDDNEIQDRKLLLGVMNKHCFKGFFHTTNFDNFVKIYDSNILGSRKYVLENRINFTDNANKSVLENTNPRVFEYVRFYYREKTPTNYSAYLNYHQESPVILLFSKNILFHRGVLFCDGNAGAWGSYMITKAKYALEFEWDSIFSHNAEFLYYDHISLEFVEKFYFRNKVDYEKAIEKFGENDKFELRRDLFV